MRKFLMYIGGAGVVAAGAAVGGWYAYKGVASEQYETQLQAAAQAAGFIAEHKGLEIEGFPFAYEGEFSDLVLRSEDGSVRVLMPEAGGRVELMDLAQGREELELELPDSFIVELLIEDTTRKVQVTSDDLEANVSPLKDGRQDIEITAEKLKFSPAEQADPLDFMEFTGVSLTSNSVDRTETSLGDIKVEMIVDAFEGRVAAQPAANEPAENLAFSMKGSKTNMEISDSLLKSVGVADTLDMSLEGPQPIKLSYQTLSSDANFNFAEGFSLGELAATFSQSAEADGADPAAQFLTSYFDALLNGRGEFAMKAETGAFEFPTEEGTDNVLINFVDLTYTGETSDGGLSGEMSTRENTFQAPSPVGAPIIGQLGLFSVGMRMPLLPEADVVQPMNIKYEFADLTLDDATWAIVDPTSALSRDLKTAIIDLSLGLEVKKNIFANPSAFSLDEETQDAAMEEAFAFHGVEVNEVKLDLMGMQADATGAFELQNDVPSGSIDVTLKGWRGLLESLAQTPWLPPAQLMLAQVTIESLVAPGPDPETSLIKLEFIDGEPYVNGKKFGG